MSTTDDPTIDAPTPDQLPDVVDRETYDRDRRRYGAYRSLMRLSPENEAAACETEAEARAAIRREAAREEPREWVLEALDERAQEVADAE